jgi:hypothetical protein
MIHRDGSLLKLLSSGHEPSEHDNSSRLQDQGVFDEIHNRETSKESIRWNILSSMLPVLHFELNIRMTSDARMMSDDHSFGLNGFPDISL